MGEAERLYGLPGAECMKANLAMAYEVYIDPYRDEYDDRSALLEEWSVCDAVSHVPTVDHIIEHAVEWVADESLLDEDGFDAFEDASKAKDVRAAFQAALDLWASKVTYRMADKHLRTLTVTWDENDEPLIDGERLYQPAQPFAKEAPCPES